MFAFGIHIIMLVKEIHIVPEGIGGARLSDYARKAFPMVPSRKGIAKAIKRGEIRVDGATGQSGDWVEPGDRIDVAEAVLSRRERQVPARVMGNSHRIVQCVGIGSKRFATAAVAQVPLLVEPGNMRQFPDEWIDDSQAGPQ